MLNFPVLMVSTQPFPAAVRLLLRLKRYGMDVAVVCPPQSKFARVSPANTVYPFRAVNPLASLCLAIDKSGAQFIIPTDDRAVWFLHELSMQNSDYRPIVERSIGPSASYPFTRNRAKLLDLAAELGIAVPPTCRIHRRADLESCLQAIGTPFFLKKDGTWAGSGVRLVSDAKEMDRSYRRLLRYPTLPVRLKRRLYISDTTAFTRLAGLGKPEIIAQACVSGVPATVMYACRDGEILGSVQARVVSARGKFGAALMIELVEDARFSHAGSLIAKALKISGFFGLDFIIEEGSGTPYLIEMNPRCTQFGHIAVANKPDLAGLLYASLTDSEIPELGDPNLGSLISFFPQAVQYDPTSSFLSQSRFDVPIEDLDGLLQTRAVERSIRLWVRGKVRDHARSLRARLQPMPAAAIHYFDRQPDRGRDVPITHSSRPSQV